MNYFQTKLARLSGIRTELGFPYRSYQTRHNCLFIHIPKTAGTSVLKALGKKGGRREHLPWYVYANANSNYFEAAYKFAFVRNPWERTLSAYLYLKSGGNKQGDLKTSESIREFNDFEDFLIRGLNEGLFRNHLLFIPQSEFIINGEGALAVDFLGRYESLTEDFKTIADVLKLKDLLPNCNMSTGERKHYGEYYRTADSRNVVSSIYKQDIQQFEYTF